MTENEIITTFEEWCNNHCEAMCTQTIPCSDCGIGTAKLVLKLYKGQKAEIESLKKQFRYLDIDCERLEKENERLQEEVGKEFTCFVGNPHKVEHCPYLEQLETATADAIKEFAEELKKASISPKIIKKVNCIY